MRVEGERNMAAETDAQAAQSRESPVWESRKLLRAARVGTLGTVVGGQPYATLVTPATAGDLSVLLLLSSLAEHTRHLTADPRCSLLVAGAAVDANPQTAPRVTLTGVAAIDPDPALKARWLAVHPYGAHTPISAISRCGGCARRRRATSAGSAARPSRVWPICCPTRLLWPPLPRRRRRSCCIATGTTRMRWP